MDIKNGPNMEFRSKDSGIDFDIDYFIPEINKRMEVMLDEKLSNLGIKTN